MLPQEEKVVQGLSSSCHSIGSITGELPVILPIDQSQVPNRDGLFALYCATLIPTYAPPPVVAFFKANETVLKVIFLSESFIDSFIGLWNSSPRHHTDSLHTIKSSKRFTSVFPAEENMVSQGSVAVRGGGHF
jgi:hypothetical protein